MCFLLSETIQETGSHKLHVKLFILVMSSYMFTEPTFNSNHCRGETATDVFLGSKTNEEVCRSGPSRH